MTSTSMSMSQATRHETSGLMMYHGSFSSSLTLDLRTSPYSYRLLCSLIYWSITLPMLRRLADTAKPQREPARPLLDALLCSADVP